MPGPATNGTVIFNPPLFPRAFGIRKGVPNCLSHARSRLHFESMELREHCSYTSKMDAQCHIASAAHLFCRLSFTFFKPV